MFHKTLVLLVIGLLLGSASCAYANEGATKKEEGDKHSKEKTTEIKNKKDELSTITGGQGANDPIYLHISPITFPVIDDNGAQQIVSLLIDLNISDRNSAIKIQSDLPRLKDILLQELYEGVSDGTMRLNEHTLNIKKIKEKVQMIVNQHYGAKTLKAVLIPAFTQRKL